VSDDKRTIGDMLADHVRERMQRERTALDDAVWALLQAGAKLEHIVIQHWPNGMGHDPTPRTQVVYSPPLLLNYPPACAAGSERGE
jgi:hypothetical protein